MGLLKQMTDVRALGRELLTINRRNLEFVYEHNPREKFLNVDDKLLAKDLLKAADIPVPPTLFAIKYIHEIRDLATLIQSHDQFVVKPTRGFGGKGILVARGRLESDWIGGGGKRITQIDLNDHVGNIISGVFHNDGRGDDTAMFEQYLLAHPGTDLFSDEGIPDIRVISFHKTPVMAMLRSPTKLSEGKANLHAGGIGVGIDLQSGITTHAISGRGPIETHPDSGKSIIGVQIPFWDEILDLSIRTHEPTGLGYLGVDVVIDKKLGPLVLEVNARPGLAIQLANMMGIIDRLRKVLN